MNLKLKRENIRCRIFKYREQKSSFLQRKDGQTKKLLNALIQEEKSPAFGGNAFSSNGWLVSTTETGQAAPGLFPPEVMVQVKALACELPIRSGVPLSRWSTPEIARQVRSQGIAATISDKTVWRWLHEDAIRPWPYRSWLFPRDPNFMVKASRILDLYSCTWNGIPLKEDEFVISADEKTSIQARRRCHNTLSPLPGSAMKVEHEYQRRGAVAYLAAMDVQRAKFFGRCEQKNGIASFDRLVEQVMTQSPYKQARRVFWIVDNGSSHRGPKSIERLEGRYPNLILVHGPIHASWLNQIEIYFSIVQRKVLTPNDIRSVSSLQNRLLDFQYYYEAIAKPFEWKFTRKDLLDLLDSIKPQAFFKYPAA